MGALVFQFGNTIMGIGVVGLFAGVVYYSIINNYHPSVRSFFKFMIGLIVVGALLMGVSCL